MKRILLVVAVVVVAVGSVVGVRAATRGPVRLPPVSADRLAAETASALASDPTISGTVVVHLDLGIPDLGDAGRLFDAKDGVVPEEGHAGRHQPTINPVERL